MEEKINENMSLTTVFAQFKYTVIHIKHELLLKGDRYTKQFVSI